MASNSGLLLALLLVATASSVANSFIVDGVTGNVDQLKFVGQVVHPQLPTACVNGLIVQIKKISDGSILCSGVTDVFGNYAIPFNPAADFHFVQTDYIVAVLFPSSAGCLASNLRGVFQAPLGLVPTLIDILLGLLTGILAQFSCGSFSFIPL